MYAGIKAIFVGVLGFVIFTFIGAAIFGGSGWVVPVGLILGVLAGFGDLAQSREKAAKQWQQRVEQEEIIREEIRRRMREE
jgi:hypothetical protein